MDDEDNCSGSDWTPTDKDFEEDSYSTYDSDGSMGQSEPITMQEKQEHQNAPGDCMPLCNSRANNNQNTIETSSSSEPKPKRRRKISNSRNSNGKR